jgi:hypothetical protein
VLKSAWIDEAVFIGDDQLVMLSNLKGKEELIGEIIGLLQSPIKNVHQRPARQRWTEDRRPAQNTRRTSRIITDVRAIRPNQQTRYAQLASLSHCNKPQKWQTSNHLAISS